MKTLAIIQSFYIPWKGYFDIINESDEFVLYDVARYTEHSWINRNQIKTPNSTQWLTVPVVTKGRYDQAIQDAELVGSTWAKKHFQTLRAFYSKAPYWKQYQEVLTGLYAQTENETHISHVNEQFVRAICKMLGIKTPIKQACEFDLSTGKTEKLIELCRQVNATRYISGPAAKDYIVPERFTEAGIELVWKDYSGYPEYPQLYGEFTHNVTVLDLLLNVGGDAPYYIWGWREK